MKSPQTHAFIPLFAGVLFAAVTLTGCSRQERTEASTKAQAFVAETRAALDERWQEVKAYSFEKRDEFRASARSLSSSMEAKISELKANVSESKASASRKAAMDELRNSEADYKAKLDALSRATADTWESAKQNVIAAWERLEASYHKARAD